MSELSELFNEAVIRWLTEVPKYGTVPPVPDGVKKVLSFEEEKYSGGYCESCAYEETVVEIRYINDDDKQSMYVYRGYFSELLRELLDA